MAAASQEQIQALTYSHLAQTQADDAAASTAAVAAQAATDQSTLAAHKGADVMTLAALQAKYDAYVASHPDPTPALSFAFGVEAVGNDVRWPGGTSAAIATSYADATKALGRNLGSRGKFFYGGQGITKAVAMRAATGNRP